MLKHFRIERILQAFLTGLLAAGLMLSQVAAAPLRPSQALSVHANARKVEESETGRYFIFFDGESALQATKANKGQIQSASVQNQVAGVRSAQVHQLKAIEKLLGRKLNESKHFDLILNAVAVPLSLEEAQLVSALPGVKDVQPVGIVALATDAGPTWVGAPVVWDDPLLTASSTSMGEGVVIGVLDTGINFDHPSFASDPDISGYTFTAPEQYYGICKATITPCNDKVIGAYYISSGTGTESNIIPEDISGHGTHTASIAAGNRGIAISSFYDARVNPPYPRYYFDTHINGLAPHAQLIAYDVCHFERCSTLDLVAGIQQAVQDGVDVISYSISSEDNPFLDPVELAFLEAFDLGVFVSAAAGNFPVMSYLSHQAPWVSTVAATSHDRKFVTNGITLREVNPVFGDIKANFSWSGPANNGLELIKPDLTAPGVSILAAYKNGAFSPSAALMSGTSMSTPFVAGAAALLISAHPTWTPAEVKSALMLTAKTEGVYKGTSNTPADPFDIGSGRIQVDKAMASGLVMDETAANMMAANPDQGGDVKTLNLPTMQSNHCPGHCTWTRTLKSVSDNLTTYTVDSSLFPWISVEPSEFTLSMGETQTLKITAREESLALQQFEFAQIDLIPDTASLPTLHLTAAVLFTPVIYYYFPYIVN